MKWKKPLALLLAGAVALGLAACGAPGAGESPKPTAPAGLFTPGTYTGKAAGMNGDVAVEVTFDSDKITVVTVGEHRETPGISDPAIDQMPGAIVAAQSTQIDTVSGATVTSKAILGAVDAAIVLAGADPAALKPITVAKPAGEAVTVEADVIVVGGGLAGLSAAVKAAQGGASVVLVEKMSVLGGSSALSGGGLGAVGSSVQKENGIEDSPQSWLDLWKERQATSPKQGDYPDWTLVEELINNSAASIDWYRSLGYEFRKPEGFGVDPVERLHFPAPEGNGSVLTTFLGKKAEELGVRILLDTKATELVQTGDAVTGVLAEGKDGPVKLSGKAVILASGGFARSEELNKRFTPEVADYVAYSVSAAGNTGDGILMAEAVGAVPYEDPWHIGLGLASPIRAMASFFWYGNFVFVNQEGERFTNEAGHYSIVYNDAAYKAPGGAFMVFDSSEAFAPYVQAAETALGDPALFKADTVEELAAAMGVDAANLKATLDAYGKGDDPFGKPAARSTPISVGPFYAVRYYPSSMGTFGGVKVGEDGNVLDASGAPIPGLYAAGEMANRPYYAQVYMSGSALQVAALTGQYAGEAAAKYAAS